MNDAVGKRLLQLLESLVGDQRVVQIQLLQPLQRGDVRDTGVGQIHSIEQQRRQLRQPRQLGQPRIAHRGVPRSSDSRFASLPISPCRRRWLSCSAGSALELLQRGKMD